MGDRSNVKITYSTGQSVYLYTHSRGSELPELVAKAVVESTRIQDESYFARFLFVRMLGDDLRDIKGELGFGIAPYPPDQQYDNDMVHIDYTDTTSTGLPVINYAHKE